MQTKRPPPVHPLEERHRALNTMFGIRPWKHKIIHKDLSERSPIVKELYEEPIPRSIERPTSYLNCSNILYTVLFGWWVSLIYLFCSLLLAATVVGIPYGRLAFKLAFYYAWPFGKFIVKTPNSSFFKNEKQALIGSSSRSGHSSKPTISYIIWGCVSCLLLWPTHMLAFVASWMTVFFIPMAKINIEGAQLLLKTPLRIDVCKDYPGPGAEVLLCAHKAFNIYYYKYSVGGMNIVLVSILFTVQMESKAPWFSLTF